MKLVLILFSICFFLLNGSPVHASVQQAKNNQQAKSVFTNLHINTIENLKLNGELEWLINQEDEKEYINLAFARKCIPLQKGYLTIASSFHDNSLCDIAGSTRHCYNLSSYKHISQRVLRI